MTAEEVKAVLTDDDIIHILEQLGATIYQNTKEYIISDTICHCGSSAKLYYYKSTKSMYCYTECGSIDILEIVCRLKKYTLPEAINWICIQCHLSDKRGFGTTSCISDWSFINNYSKSKEKIKESNTKYFDKKILNIFQDKYYQGWIDEGISIESMKKYSIKYSSFLNRIIIPHYDIDNNIIGIRGRTLTESDEEQFGKYSPIKIGNTIFNHSLGNNLYGININAETIRQKQKVLIVEGEKSVLQADTMFGSDNFTLAVCGSSFHSWQRNMLIKLGVKEVIIGLDKQYEDSESSEADAWAKHIFKEFVKPLSAYFAVYVLWDNDNVLGYKQSPTDCGKDVLLKLMKNKIYVPSSE